MRNTLIKYLINSLCRKTPIIALSAIAFMTVISCNNGNRDNSKALAEYGDNVLFWDDLKNSFPEGLAEKDSIKLLKKMVDDWVINQLLVERASQNIDIESIDIEQRVEKYRNDLFVHHYKHQLLKEKLDTVVTKEQIEQYYNDHADEFRLRENILSYYFIKVPISVPDAYKVNSWLHNASNEDVLNRLKEYSYQNARYYDFDGTWSNFARLEKLLQPKYNDQESFLKNYRVYQKRDSLYHYFLRINEYLLKGDIAPMDYIYNELKQVIISKRKIEFISKLENELKQDAANNKRIKINI